MNNSILSGNIKRMIILTLKIIVLCAFFLLLISVTNSQPQSKNILTFSNLPLNAQKCPLLNSGYRCTASGKIVEILPEFNALNGGFATSLSNFVPKLKKGFKNGS